MLSDAFGTRQEWIHQERKNAQTDEPSDLKQKADDIPVRPSVNDEKLAFPASKAIAYCKVKRASFTQTQTQHRMVQLNLATEI